MRGTIKTIRDAEASLLKALTKAKGKKSSSETFYDPKKPKAVRIYVATTFPEWQDTCVQIIKEAYSKEEDKVDDAMVKQLLSERELIKDKRAMPFIQAFKKRMSQYGAETTFRRTLLFSESVVLRELLAYLKKTLNLAEAEVMSVEDARSKEQEQGYTKSIINTSEPGSPAFEYYNVQ